MKLSFFGAGRGDVRGDDCGGAGDGRGDDCGGAGDGRGDDCGDAGLLLLDFCFFFSGDF